MYDKVNENNMTSTVLKDFNKLEGFVSDFTTNSFGDITEIIDNYDSLISKLYVDLSEEKRKASIGKISSLDFLNEDFDPILKQLEKLN